MEKVFILKGLDCPHCASKIEKAVGETDGIEKSSVNLMKQTLKVSGDFNKDKLFDTVEKIVHTYEPDVEVLSEKPAGEEAEEEEDEKWRIIIGASIYAAGLILSHFTHVPDYIPFGIFIVAYITLGGNVLVRAFKNILKGHVFDENFLMTVSTIGAFGIGSYSEAVAVMLFYRIGEYFEDKAVAKSRKNISALLDIRPDYANVRRNDVIYEVSPEEVEIGEYIIIKPGEKIPLDGVIADGVSMLDTRALTGESAPREVKKGDAVLSGCINQGGALTVEVTKSFGQSTASKIIDLVENASEKKAPAENFITTFARYYTPIVVICAVFLALIPPLAFGGAWAEWIKRGCVFLVISCPCALVISIPLTFFGGIGAASRKGVLVKGGNYLEVLNKVGSVYFDKTGTLTKGVFEVSEVTVSNGFTREEVLGYAAKAESFSNHPIAKSIEAAYGKAVDADCLSDYTEIAGHGVTVMSGEDKIIAGNEKAMQRFNIPYEDTDSVGTKVYVAVNDKYAGCIIIADEAKPDSQKAIEALKKRGIKTVMLTGDNEKTASAIAHELEIDEYYAELLPAEKVKKIEENRESGKTAFVGDGINDAPVLARADVGIAMGGLGSDAAIEAADVVLMTDEPSKITDALDCAKATKRIVMQNIIFALGIKAVFLILGALGIAGMWVAVFGDVGVMIIAVLNSLRIMQK